MQEQNLFEYAVIRIVPHVEREEFLNVGVVLYCAKQQFLQTIFKLDEERLKALCKKTDLEMVAEYLHAFNLICNGGSHAGPIGKLSMAERFRWLTATRSTVLQTSKVHPGLCKSAVEMLRKLYEEMVC